jgi:hypothetical protein
VERERAELAAEAAGDGNAHAASSLRRAAEPGADLSPARTRATDAPSNLTTWSLLKDRIDFADDEADETGSSENVSERAEPVRGEPVRAEPIGDDADSIERYMASLMDRVGGRSGSTPEKSSAASFDADRPSSPSGPSPSSSRAPAPAAEPERPRPVIRKVQTVTPEEVARMRELANLNARVAITRHGAKQLVPNIFGKALLSAVAWALAVAGYLLNTKHDVVLFCGAAACALVGAMFFARTLTTATQLFASRRAAPAAADKAGAN